MHDDYLSIVNTGEKRKSIINALKEKFGKMNTSSQLIVLPNYNITNNVKELVEEWLFRILERHASFDKDFYPILKEMGIDTSVRLQFHNSMMHLKRFDCTIIDDCINENPNKCLWLFGGNLRKPHITVSTDNSNENYNVFVCNDKLELYKTMQEHWNSEIRYRREYNQINKYEVVLTDGIPNSEIRIMITKTPESENGKTFALLNEEIFINKLLELSLSIPITDLYKLIYENLVDDWNNYQFVDIRKITKQSSSNTEVTDQICIANNKVLKVKITKDDVTISIDEKGSLKIDMNNIGLLSASDVDCINLMEKITNEIKLFRKESDGIVKTLKHHK